MAGPLRGARRTYYRGEIAGGTRPHVRKIANTKYVGRVPRPSTSLQGADPANAQNEYFNANCMMRGSPATR